MSPKFSILKNSRRMKRSKTNDRTHASMLALSFIASSLHSCQHWVGFDAGRKSYGQMDHIPNSSFLQHISSIPGLYHNCVEENCVQENCATSWPRARKCAWTKYAPPALVSGWRERSVQKLRQVKKQRVDPGWQERNTGNTNSPSKIASPSAIISRKLVRLGRRGRG